MVAACGGSRIDSAVVSGVSTALVWLEASLTELVGAAAGDDFWDGEGGASVVWVVWVVELTGVTSWDFEESMAWFCGAMVGRS